MMHLPHNLHDFYAIVGSLVVGYFLNSFVDWLKHAFWVGFKAGLAAQAKKGAPLTPDETAEVKKQVNAQLMAEYNKKLLKVADAVDQ